MDQSLKAKLSDLLQTLAPGVELPTNGPSEITENGKEELLTAFPTLTPALFDVPENRRPLKRALESLHTCQGCEGLADCRQEIPGYAVRLRGGIANLYEGVSPCAFRQAFKKLADQEKILASSMIPEGLKSKGLRNFEPTPESQKALAAAQEIVRDPGRKGAVFAGTNGAGKTHLAVAVLNNRLKTGGTGLYVLVADLLGDIRRTFDSNGGAKETELMEAVSNSALLVLDDLGAERCSEWVAEILFRLLDRRVKLSRQTIITTNFPTPEALTARLTPKDDHDGMVGKRIVSRVLELCDWVEIGGQDKRLA